MFSFFKKKKIVPHIKLSGVIGNVGKFKQGIDFAGQQEIIKKAFSIKKALAVAISINSPGGSITSLFAIYDTMKYIKPDVATVCMGLAASAGAVILAGGTPGKRYSLPHARIMLHQPAGGAEGTSKDIEIQAKLITDMRNQINGLLADFTKKNIEQIAVDTDRDFWMTAQEALEYGIVDEVLTQRELADKK